MYEVIQRTEKQYRVYTLLRPRNLSGIPGATTGNWMSMLGTGRLPRLFDMMRNGINQMNFVSFARQPQSMHARSSSDVKDFGAGFWQVSTEDVLGSQPLELADAFCKALRLSDFAIVFQHLGGNGVDIQVPTPLRLKTVLISRRF